jgi:hypothetical protein
MPESTSSSQNSKIDCSPKRLPVCSTTVLVDLNIPRGAHVNGNQLPTAEPSCNSSSRRHGRFLVQPLMDSGISTTPSNVRNSSPATSKIQMASKLQSSPTQSSILTERRPSRIIGRFEVCDLFDESKACSQPCNVALQSVDVVQKELTNTGETCATTPVKDHEMSA